MPPSTNTTGPAYGRPLERSSTVNSIPDEFNPSTRNLKRKSDELAFARDTSMHSATDNHGNPIFVTVENYSDGSKRCIPCDTFLGNSAAMTRHAKLIHSAGSTKCTHCDPPHPFSSPEELSAHYAVRHPWANGIKKSDNAGVTASQVSETHRTKRQRSATTTEEAQPAGTGYYRKHTNYEVTVPPYTSPRYKDPSLSTFLLTPSASVEQSISGSRTQAPSTASTCLRNGSSPDTSDQSRATPSSKVLGMDQSSLQQHFLNVLELIESLSPESTAAGYLFVGLMDGYEEAYDLEGRQKWDARTVELYQQVRLKGLAILDAWQRSPATLPRHLDNM